ncbi:hypothetical protein [Streptomyces sp. NBC_00572]|uniref:hypothetical protein n=1 Tax=Streptomyces sp. NBC_00572 TaxID=2903664 RepID=UPI002251039D|nr:hypothetical protein [Streptomyces sp. NBC_00572]MCX4979836.1 hypothetical protein [Streptomyces sp. NBC_00572]
MAGGPVLEDLGCHDVRHYGIRSFCDYITDDARRYDQTYYDDLERLELATTARAPYMHTARLFQLTARKRTDSGGGTDGRAARRG